MASYALQPFQRCDEITVFSAIEAINATQIQVAFWLTDPYQQVIYPAVAPSIQRQDFLWEQTCFELFMGLKQSDEYREIHCSPAQSWQAYAFEEYRYPEQMPPVQADDIELLFLQRTKYGVNASIDVKKWLNTQQKTLMDVYVGMTAVIQTNEKVHYFAMQHSGQHADFHNKRDWLHLF